MLTSDKIVVLLKKPLSEKGIVLAKASWPQYPEFDPAFSFLRSMEIFDKPQPEKELAFSKNFWQKNDIAKFFNGVDEKCLFLSKAFYSCNAAECVIERTETAVVSLKAEFKNSEQLACRYNVELNFDASGSCQTKIY